MATAKKATARKATARKATAKKPAAKTAPAKPPAAKTTKLKTAPTRDSVDAFIAKQGSPRSEECSALAKLMARATGAPAKMWGSSIVGFGDWHYKYETGREGDFFEVGFSPRKAALTVYINGGYEKHADLLAKLGKHSIGKSCLYLKSLDDVDLEVLAQLIARGVSDLRARG